MSKKFTIDPGSVHLLDDDWDVWKIAGTCTETGGQVAVFWCDSDMLPYSCGMQEWGDYHGDLPTNWLEIAPEIVACCDKWMQDQYRAGVVLAQFVKPKYAKKVVSEDKLDMLLAGGFEPLHHFVNPNTGNEVFSIIRRIV